MPRKLYGWVSTLFSLHVGASVLKSSRYISSMKPYYLTPESAASCADVYLVPMFDDNYGYIIVDRDSKVAAIVDPGEPTPVDDAVKSLGLNLKALFCTHKHGDHAGGNRHFADKYPLLDVIATKYEPIPAANKLVGDGDEFKMGSLNVKTFYTPCHTRGHVIFLVSGSTGSPILFSGDTLFVGGCGKFFEGEPNEMLSNMDRIASLPEDTLVYCAHEYTQSNFKYLAHIDPITCGAKYENICERRSAGLPTVPSTIVEEKATNLFLQCRKERIQDLLGCGGDAVETMARLRQRKNEFR